MIELNKFKYIKTMFAELKVYLAKTDGTLVLLGVGDKSKFIKYYEYYVRLLQEDFVNKQTLIYVFDQETNKKKFFDFF